MELGMGWKVGKDAQGDWMPLPGGALTYEDALDRAERRALLQTYQAPEGEEPVEGTEGEATPRRRTKGGESVADYAMKKMVDRFVAGDKDTDDSEVKVLRGRIEQMEKDRQDERFERLEGLVAGIAGRDPWDDYDRIQQMRRKLGLDTQVVTDQSPAVQLIKDATDKFDKNVNRLVGVVERVALKEEFKPEETRSLEERETKAGELLSEAQARDRSRSLRHRTFGF